LPSPPRATLFPYTTLFRSFEHPPGRESCVTCHDPHGSSNERLLVAKVPMLCQRCHIGTRHPSTIYDANQLTSVRLFGRACVQCRSEEHTSELQSRRDLVCR